MEIYNNEGNVVFLNIKALPKSNSINKHTCIAIFGNCRTSNSKRACL